ncbi:D-glycero-beta-D-manno-heptose-7-phosphate kinase [Verrucomicrobia bacterium]|nr:D-glycero-beta-D-manno-heptose-7-phosphate kinase [Verrucomicrobiota bacterium]
MKELSSNRVKQILRNAKKRKILVIGDVMLDQFIWGQVDRISPEAPVPVVNFQRESFMPGGAANVARNLAAMNIPVWMYGLTGRDGAAKKLRKLLEEQKVDCSGLVSVDGRLTSRKTRIIAHQQQVVRIDRETREPVDEKNADKILKRLIKELDETDAIIVGDYAKGVVTQEILENLKEICHARGIWLSLDPKPAHHLDLTGLSLITPNRKEAYELAGVLDSGSRAEDPLKDKILKGVADKLLKELSPALLLITLGDQGMLLCRAGAKPYHIPTIAQEVFDVSGAGDTVISSFTLAIAGGASPVEAAIFSNHASGVVVGKMGTATTTQAEVQASFGTGR